MVQTTTDQLRSVPAPGELSQHTAGYSSRDQSLREHAVNVLRQFIASGVEPDLIVQNYARRQVQEHNGLGHCDTRNHVEWAIGQIATGLEKTRHWLESVAPPGIRERGVGTLEVYFVAEERITARWSGTLRWFNVKSAITEPRLDPGAAELAQKLGAYIATELKNGYSLIPGFTAQGPIDRTGRVTLEYLQPRLSQ